MKKLYIAIVAISALTMGSQLIASSQNPRPLPPLPASGVPGPARVPKLLALDRGQLLLAFQNLDDGNIIAMAPHFPKGMETLVLSGNNIGPAGAKAIAKSLIKTPGLKYIDLKGNHIGVDGARAIVQNLPAGFKDLILSQNNLGDAGVKALAERPFPINLEVLNLEDNRIGNAGVKSLAEQPFPISLEAIYLQDNNIGDAGIIALAQNLQQNARSNPILKIKNNKFGNEGKQALRNAGYHELQDDTWIRDISKPAPAPAMVMPAVDKHGILDLSNLELGDAGIIARAPHFPEGMTQLLLKSNNIGSAGAEAIANNLFRAPGLQNILLNDNHIGIEGVRAIVQNLPADFEDLMLSSNNLGDAGVEALVAHPLPPKLETLILSHNNIGDAGIIALAQSLQQHPIANHSMLILAGNEFGDEGEQALRNAGYREGEGSTWVRDVPMAAAPAVVMPALYHGILGLSYKNLGDAGIIAMAPRFPEGMEDLILDNNNIGPEGAKAIAKNLNRAPGLEIMNLMHNNIGVDGARAIIQNLPAGFKELILLENNLGDAGAKALAERPFPINLESLNLQGNNIGDAGAKALARHPFPIKLELLKLSDNPIGDDGIIALAQNLQQNPHSNPILIIKNNKFGNDGKQALHNAGYIEYKLVHKFGDEGGKFEGWWVRNVPAAAAGQGH